MLVEAYLHGYYSMIMFTTFFGRYFGSKLYKSNGLYINTIQVL